MIDFGINMFCLMMVLLHDIYSAIKIAVDREHGGPRLQWAENAAIHTMYICITKTL